MCGIAGIFQAEKISKNARSKLKAMIGTLYHRGPDECGFYFDQKIAMGMARLSIIDLIHGSQPISNEKQNIWIVFNGEIYNYKELRKTLENAGHVFTTKSDTEVIVHSYEQWGLDFVKHLNGQFAISIWDRRKQQLVLARDRLGIRPLFYFFQKNRLIFASEIKAILAEGSVQPEADLSALNEIFTLWVNVPPKTPFKNIFELPPGRLLVINQKGIKEIEYWDIPFKDETGPFRLSSIKAELYSLLEDAVKIRLRADVPVGAYLSGGLDSSIITALVNKIHQNRLKTFSVNFSNQSYDEQFYQKILIKRLNTEHRSLLVNEQDIFNHFFKVIKLSEKPLLRTAPAPLLALSSLVRKDQFKVVLTGEGADEFFAGYNIFKETRLRHFWARDPNSKSRPLLLSKIYPYIFNKQGAMNPFWQAFFKRHLTETENPLYSHLLRWENSAKIRLLLSDTLKGTYDFEQLQATVLNYLKRVKGISTPLARAQYIEAKLFMNGYLLSSQGDRMLMGHSVEGRFPFLDHRVVEFAASLPDDLKLRGLNEKYILKKTFYPMLPQAISSRPKQPYRAPIAGYIFNNGKMDWLQEMLKESTIHSYGYFDPKKVKILKNKILHQAERISLVDEMAILAVLSTQLWHYHFFENFRHSEGKLADRQKIVDQRNR